VGGSGHYPHHTGLVGPVFADHFAGAPICSPQEIAHPGRETPFSSLPRSLRGEDREVECLEKATGPNLVCENEGGVSGTIAGMHGTISPKEKVFAFLSGIFIGTILMAVLLYQIPAVRERLSWRLDFAMTYLRGIVNPVRPLPTAIAAPPGGLGEDSEWLLAEITNAAPTVTVTPTPTIEPATPIPTATATLTPTPLPASVQLDPPAYELQDINNCGPATIAMHMRYYGWQGNQTTIAAEVKPLSGDRNVNVEELVAYIHTQVVGLEVQYRVGGDIEILKRLIAAGYPVTVEEGFIMAESYWLNDDHWAGHYLLLTGYDDALQQFTAQDSFVGANLQISYQELDERWKAFNRVYIIIYPNEQRPAVQALLQEQWGVNANRQHALDLALKETELDSTDSYAWFNLGTNLVYFEKYSQAAIAYDNARNAGLPQRMLRYQFGPFFAYFHTGRIEDLLALTEYALGRTPNSEEAMLWRGWAYYRLGDRNEAVRLFNDALEARPNYPDALYGLDFVHSN